LDIGNGGDNLDIGGGDNSDVSSDFLRDPDLGGGANVGGSSIEGGVNSSPDGGSVHPDSALPCVVVDDSSLQQS